MITFLILIAAIFITYLVYFQNKIKPYKQKLDITSETINIDFSSVEVILKSDFGIDYTVLRDLLSSEKWRAANDETNKIMGYISLLNRVREGGSGRYFAVAHYHCNSLCAIDTFCFPQSDINTIDQLWVKYSRGRFGFSVQKQIWLRMGGEIKLAPSGNRFTIYQLHLWFDFEKRIQQYEKIYNNLSFGLHAPPGHLPALGKLFLNYENKKKLSIYLDRPVDTFLLEYLYHNIQ